MKQGMVRKLVHSKHFVDSRSQFWRVGVCNSTAKRRRSRSGSDLQLNLQKFPSKKHHARSTRGKPCELSSRCHARYATGGAYASGKHANKSTGVARCAATVKERRQPLPPLLQQRACNSARQLYSRWKCRLEPKSDIMDQVERKKSRRGAANPSCRCECRWTLGRRVKCRGSRQLAPDGEQSIRPRQNSPR